MFQTEFNCIFNIQDLFLSDQNILHVESILYNGSLDVIFRFLPLI